MSKLLEVRNELKAKKPVFLRQDAHKLKRLGDGWRKPKGRHSQMREKRRSHRRQPGVGFSSPIEVRGLTREGFEQVVVHNISELEGKKNVIIASNVGMKNKIEIVKKAKELGINILNVKKPDDFLVKVQEEMKKRKELVKKRKEKKVEKKETKEEKKEEKTKELDEKLKEDKRKVLEKGL